MSLVMTRKATEEELKAARLACKQARLEMRRLAEIKKTASGTAYECAQTKYEELVKEERIRAEYLGELLLQGVYE